MKKYLFKTTLLVATFILVSCSDSNNEPPKPDPIFSTEGVYIVNEGINAANSTLSYYNKETEELSADVFKTQNGTPLGDGAQDMLIYGSKMYITTTTTNNVYITDLKANLLKYTDGSVAKIDLTKEGIESPRSVTSSNGKVYVNYYSGHIAQIDTTTMKVEKTIGGDADYKQLEGMTVIGNKLYTGEGDLSRNRVAVVDLVNFKFETSIQVANNPDRIASDALGNLFTLSKRYDENWKTITTLTHIKTDGTKKEFTIAAGEMAVLEGKVLLVTRGYLDTKTSFTYYDIYKEQMGDTPFITITDDNIAKQLESAYIISVDPTSKDIYISTTDYVNEASSKMFVFSKAGQYKTHFDTKGGAPRGAYFVTKQTN